MQSPNWWKTNITQADPPSQWTGHKKLFSLNSAFMQITHRNPGSPIASCKISMQDKPSELYTQK